jgi:glucosylglycerol-phosphate synthase
MLLATDLDGTFLGGDTDSKTRLYQVIASHPGIDLVFVTGRGLESVIPLLSDPTIPQPDYIICDVGGTVVHGDTLQPLHPLQSEIDQLWPGEHIVERKLAHIDNIHRQEVPQERRCSYFCDEDAVTEEIHELVNELDCDLLYSNSLYLDVLPRGVNKGQTLTRLIEHLEEDHKRVLVAGDTLNDLSMFTQSFSGVCVGESEPGLLESTRHLSQVYHAERPGCGGILEAISYFGHLGPAGIEEEVDDAHKSGKSDMVIVYHRLPYEERVENGVITRQRPRSPNGIIPTLLSLFADDRAGSWVAWSLHDGDSEHFETHTEVDAENYPHLTAARVPLSAEDVDVFYKKFSKEAFWPTLHTFWERASFEEDHWEVFKRVNRRFAERTAAEAALNATIWIHDYNLWMVPAYLRELRPDLTIAFFHHTYFPSADVFNVVPWRREIVGSLLQCDYIGFHIPRQAENFVDVARGVMPLEVKQRSNCAPRFLSYGCAVGLDEMTTCIKVNDRYIGLGAHPVGLDVSRVENVLAESATRQRMEELRRELNGQRLILSVERLDFTKGILEKLEAYEQLLAEHPELEEKVTLIMICVPAAKGMTIYDELQAQIEQTVGRINGRLARVGWTPVQFFFRPLPFEHLVSYYTMADVMWITPLRDGLNLVSKEYVATQGLTGGSGVLVLSEFAGAAAELRGAVLTNPHDPRELIDSCYFALSMGKAEARSRLAEAFDIVQHYDIEYWARDFLASVSQYGEPDQQTASDTDSPDHDNAPTAAVA